MELNCNIINRHFKRKQLKKNEVKSMTYGLQLLRLFNHINFEKASESEKY